MIVFRMPPYHWLASPPYFVVDQYSSGTSS